MLAYELSNEAIGIRVNAICPGTFLLTPLLFSFDEEYSINESSQLQDIFLQSLL